MTVAGVADYLRLVKFSHSIFALPFAFMAAWLAANGAPPLRTLALVVLCAVAARTAAMSFNRLVDRDIDAVNPRTRTREIPAGVLRPGAVRLLVLIASAVFVGGAFLLNSLCGWLAVPVLACLLGYSYAKRFTWLAHVWLGLTLALAPLGAWLAVRGELTGDLTPPLLLAAAVLAWVAGFDLIYACQDAAFDVARGLHSIPARFGERAALGLSRLFHLVTVLLLALLGSAAGLTWVYGLGVALTAALLVWEHRLVRPGDLSRVDVAFFTVNGWVGVGLFAAVALDRSLAG